VAGDAGLDVEESLRSVNRSIRPSGLGVIERDDSVPGVAFLAVGRLSVTDLTFDPVHPRVDRVIELVVERVRTRSNVVSRVTLLTAVLHVAEHAIVCVASGPDTVPIDPVVRLVGLRDMTAEWHRPQSS
jgi:hypothetical protein